MHNFWFWPGTDTVANALFQCSTMLCMLMNAYKVTQKINSSSVLFFFSCITLHFLVYYSSFITRNEKIGRIKKNTILNFLWTKTNYNFSWFLISGMYTSHMEYATFVKTIVSFMPMHTLSLCPVIVCVCVRSFVRHVQRSWISVSGWMLMISNGGSTVREYSSSLSGRSKNRNIHTTFR